MHYLLDIRTLSLGSGVISLILCLCMLFVSRKRKTYAGFSQWTIASILTYFGMLFLSLRDIFPDFFTIVVANTLIIVSYGLIADGIEIFTHGPRRIWLFISLGVLTFFSFLYFTYYSPNINARIIVISAALTILFGYCGYIVHRYVPLLIKDKNVLLTAVFGIQAVFSALRLIEAAFFEGPVVDFMDASATHGASFVFFSMGNIFVIIGLIILNFQRVENDMFATIEEVKTLRGVIPICSSCKKIRDDEGIWSQIETYIRDHSEVEFSHGLCPDCVKKLYPDFPKGGDSNK